MIVERAETEIQRQAEYVMADVVRKFGGEVRVPVLTRVRFRSGTVLWFGDQIRFQIGLDGLYSESISHYPSRDRASVAEELRQFSLPAGMTPYVRGKREVQIPVLRLLRHLSRQRDVLSRCPWLPKRLAAIELLEALV